MKTPLQHRTPRIIALLGALGLGACGAPSASSRNGSAARPVDVASTIAGCSTLDDCVRQCAEKRATGCVSAGRLYEFGHGVTADPSRAFPLYEEACELKYAGGCYNAAVLLEAGKGVERDQARAHGLFAKVCQMGSNTACAQAQALGEDGKQ